MHAAPVPVKRGHSVTIVTFWLMILTLYVVLFQVYPLQHWNEIGSTLACSILCTSQNISPRQGDRNALLLQEHRTHWSQPRLPESTSFHIKEQELRCSLPTIFNWTFRIYRTGKKSLGFNYIPVLLFSCPGCVTKMSWKPKEHKQITDDLELLLQKARTNHIYRVTQVWF